MAYPLPPLVYMMLRPHASALVAALLFALLVAGPFILSGFATNFADPYPELTNDQSFYLARIQDIRDGYPVTGNAYLAEHKNALPMQFLTGEYLEALILDLLSLPTSASLILFTLFFTPIIFLLTYAIFLVLKAPRHWGLLATLLLTFGIYFFDFARPISPQFNFIFWLVAVLAFFTLYERTDLRSLILQAGTIGILFYLYPYYWTHLLATLGVLVLVELVRSRAAALRTVLIVLLALAFGSGYLVLLAAARALPEYYESLFRLGFIETHTPSGLSLVLIALAALVAALYIAQRSRGTRLLPPVALLIGGIVALNQHLVTGLNMEFASHYGMQIIFASAFLIAAAVSAREWWPLLEKRAVKGVAAVIVLFLTLFSVSAPYQELSSHLPPFASYELVAWLTAHAEPGVVVYAPEALSLIIPAYTSADVFYARNANAGFITNNEVVDRFIIQNYGATIDDAFIEKHQREVFGHHYLNTYGHALQKARVLSLLGIDASLPPRIPRDALERVKARAAELQSKPFAEIVAPYRLDYIVDESGTIHAYP